MEEFVGGLWDRFITRSARRDHPEAAVKLADLERTLGILFRALGGDAGLRVAPASTQRHGARRRWLSRVAATDDRSASASLDLRRPRSISKPCACRPRSRTSRTVRSIAIFTSG
jgi:nitric oxide reductase NorD protein